MLYFISLFYNAVLLYNAKFSEKDVLVLVLMWSFLMKDEFVENKSLLRIFLKPRLILILLLHNRTAILRCGPNWNEEKPFVSFFF